MNLVKQYFKDLYILFSSKLINNKLHIFILYNFFCLKVLLFKIFKIDFKKESFLGFTVFFDNYSAFFAQFAELFIYNIYHFTTKNKVPFIVDCWWNIWMSILYFKYLYSDSKIVCFEPDKYAFKFLSNTVKHNNLNNVEFINKAVSWENWQATFYSFKDIKWWSWNTLEKNYATFGNSEEYVVEIVKLTDYNFEKIDFLKIDIEWSEWKLFDDFQKTNFLERVENINLEYHYDFYTSNNSLSLILSAMEDKKFNVIINWNIFQRIFTRSDLYEAWEKKYLLIIQAYK